MRILHTSDWHLGCKLFSIDRQPDIRARLGEIGSYLDEHEVDVMVVAGDVFHKKHHRTEELQRAVGDLREVFKPFLLRGGTIVAISGNHDHEALFTTLRMAQDMAAPIDETIPGLRPPGRLYLGAQPGVLLLQDRAGQQVQFVLLPYPTPERYLKGEDTDYHSPEDKHSRLQRGLIRHLEALRQRLDPRLPSVLVAHAHVRGSQLHNLYEIELKDDVVFDPAHLPGNFAYTAYGHIHRAQEIGGSERIRYSGSIERMNKDERDDIKGVIVIDVTQEGGGRPATLPLSATPIQCFTIVDPEADLKVLEALPERERTILYYALDVPPEDNKTAILQAVQRLFPRSVREASVEQRADGQTGANGREDLAARLRDLPGTVTGYLMQSLRDHPRRDQAIALVQRLLAQEVQP